MYHLCLNLKPIIFIHFTKKALVSKLKFIRHKLLNILRSKKGFILTIGHLIEYFTMKNYLEKTGRKCNCKTCGARELILVISYKYSQCNKLKTLFWKYMLNEYYQISLKNYLHFCFKSSFLL